MRGPLPAAHWLQLMERRHARTFRTGPPDTRTAREKALEEKVGSRTILVVLIALVALVEAIVIVHLAF